MTNETAVVQHELINDTGIKITDDAGLDSIDALLGEEEPEAKDNEEKQIEKTNDEIDEKNDEQDADDESEVETETEIDDSVDYNQEFEIPMPYGMEKMTLSEMKDKVSNIHMETKRVQEQENALMVKRQEITAVMNAIGDVPPEIAQIIKQQNQANLYRENQLMLEAVPEWKDVQTFNADRSAMGDLVKQYGFNDTEFNGVADHRLIKMIRDYSQLKSRFEKADPKKVTKAKTKKSRVKQNNTKRDNQILSDAAKSSSPQLKQKAIAQLLGE